MLNYTQLRQQFRSNSTKALLAPKSPYYTLIIAFLALAVLLVVMAGCSFAGEPINIEKLATAIGRAENSKTYPYGILKRYKHTTPRQACVNTIKSALKRYQASITQGGRRDFIEFLGAIYCPIEAANDPTGLNKNWVKNVRYYYGKT